MEKTATPRILNIHQELLLCDAQIQGLEKQKEEYITVIKEFMGENTYELVNNRGILLARWKPYTEHRFDLELYKSKHYQTYVKYLKPIEKRPFKFKF